MVKQTLALAAMFLGVVTSAQGPQTGPIEFGRVGGVPGGRRATTFTGRADQSEHVGGVTTFRGNVYIVFADSNIVVRADDVTWADDSNELSIRGNVRLRLDAPGRSK